ncbi:retinol dehydrogenase 12 [Phyllosticta citricarpa]|uniref:Retinol dehydrogenase 12 n=2 Tax=Phyllosticta TaxID=121621 RepID=A0ABR1NJD5_9PEZI
MPYITTLLYSQFFFTPPSPNDDFSEQVVIVTGSNTGLGYEAAKHLIRLNAALVIVAVRTKSKGDAAVQSLVESTGCAPERLQVWELDLSNFDSIKKFSARVRTLERLDAVIQNAGILTYNWSVAEGNESHITVNVFGAVLLGLEVLPKLRESAAKHRVRGRLSFVGSDLQYVASFNEKKESENIFDALALEDKANMNDRYRTSKLLLLFAVRALAKASPLSEKSNVIINCMTPGACMSDIFRDDVHWLQKKVIYGAMSMFARATEVGARTLVQAISPALGTEYHGAFVMDCKVAPPGSNVDGVENENLAEKVWNQLVERLEKVEPGVTRI